MIDRATIDRILDATRIEEVIGDFITLKRRGANYLGLCPFHQDKNPSMSVSSTRQIFKCFSCGKAGTAVSFLMEHEHISYPEALKYLAKKYGIEIVETEETAEEAANRLKYESLLIVSEYAQKFYQDILWSPDKSKLIGLSYFKERKFSDEIIKRFGLGFAPGGKNSLAKSAIADGYNPDYLVECGLCILREEDGSVVDRFYDRVMFPIHSLSGRVIAFGGRILTNEKSKAKYINSPESEIYVKNRVLYGIYQAKGAIAKKDRCLLVEGYTDVLSMHQAGIENVVASSGTSLTVGQIALIKRFTENITVIYDGDEAGIKASIRGIDMILSEGMKVKVVLLPKDEDPDSFAKGHSSEEIEEYIESKSQDFISFKTNLLLNDIGNDPLKRAQLINDLIGTIAVVPDQIERNVYVDMVAERFDVKQDSIFQKITLLRRRNREMEQSRRRLDQVRIVREESQNVEGYEAEEFPNSPERVEFISTTNSILSVNEKELIYYVLKFGEYPLYQDDDLKYSEQPHSVPTVAQYIQAALAQDELQFETPLYRAVFEEYMNLMRGEYSDCEVAQGVIIRYFTNHRNQQFSSLMLSLIADEHPITVKAFRESLVPEEQLLGKNVPKAVLLYKSKVVDVACSDINKAIIEAQKNGDSAAVKENMSKLMMLSKVKSALTKELSTI